MPTLPRIIVGPVLALALGACSSGEENVLFVTSTDIGIDADAKTGSANIGVGRNEGMIGPVYVDSGGTPPIVASIQSNLSIFNPKVNQLYATGNAARFATGATERELRIGDPDELSGRRRAMFFGTTSNVGLKLGFTEGSPAPTSISLGYKRRELSIIPLIPTADRKKEDKDKYASVFASIGLDTSTGSIFTSGVKLDQFFATGWAADALAREAKSVFVTKAKDAANDALTVVPKPAP